MIMTIYDYNDKAKEITLPDKEIDAISVTVLSGDETGTVYFTDGTKLDFDASDCREVDFYDGNYIVRGRDIEDWLNYKPTSAYERQRVFEFERGDHHSG